MPRYSSEATRRQWRQRLARFGRSGLPVAQFCTREGVSVASFYNWRKRLKVTGARRRAGQRVSFQRVTVVPASPGV